jgi:GrpB-like predicted nucleotidyltransferase (UPF0157 family)
MASRYFFSEYSRDWPVEFHREADRIRRLLEDAIADVHHIGSTSVPGLAAKPVIDLLPVVRGIAEVDERASSLVTDGYKSWGEYGIAGRRFFTRDCDGVRTHNVHVFAADSPEIERHLAFAAYLHAHEEVRREYEALKREVYARHPADIAAYSAGKDAWIKRFEPLAVAWYRKRGQRNGDA